MAQSLWCVLNFVKCSLFSDLGLFDLNGLWLLYVQMAPMHVRYAREVPEYEIDPKELDFTNSVEITKVTFICSFLQSWYSELPFLVVGPL